MIKLCGKLTECQYQIFSQIKNKYYYVCHSIENCDYIELYEENDFSDKKYKKEDLFKE